MIAAEPVAAVGVPDDGARRCSRPAFVRDPDLGSAIVEAREATRRGKPQHPVGIEQHAVAAAQFGAAWHRRETACTAAHETEAGADQDVAVAVVEHAREVARRQSASRRVMADLGFAEARHAALGVTHPHAAVAVFAERAGGLQAGRGSQQR